jgi:hypothetical protein
MKMSDHDSNSATPAHTPGTPKGEEGSKYGNSPGWHGNTRTSRDATGVNADARRPIDPRMPNMPPA